MFIMVNTKFRQVNLRLRSPVTPRGKREEPSAAAPLKSAGRSPAYFPVRLSISLPCRGFPDKIGAAQFRPERRGGAAVDVEER